MEEKRRQTGIDLLGSYPWGTHFCQFYETKEDLIEILVPYFKAGLENNEFCMWITSEPLHVDEAMAALGKVVDNLAGYIAEGQIEILDVSQWYTRSGRFDSGKVLQGWVDKEKDALERGFDGLRLTGPFWLENRDWTDYTAYEAAVHSVIDNYRMIALCTYSLNKCGTSEILDVMSNHQFALIRRKGEWEVIESSRHKRIEETLRDRETELSVILDNVPIIMMLVDQEGGVQKLNRAAIQFAQRPAEEMIGLHGGEAFRCLYSLDDPKGCGFGPYCQTCVARLTVRDTFQSGNNHHQVESKLPFLRKEIQEELTYLVSTALIKFSKGDRVLVCIEDITERTQIAQELQLYSENLEQKVEERTAELDESTKQLRELSQRLVNAQEEERRMIARDLHDQIGQTLTVVNFLVDTALKSPSGDIHAILSEAKAALVEAIQETRDMSLRMRPVMLDDLGLLPTLIWQFQDYTDKTAIQIDFQHSGLDGDFPTDIRTAAYRIIQEALTNIARHAGVNEARVIIQVEEETLFIKIEDHGKGFDQAVLTLNGSIGQSGMRERAYALGGTLKIESELGFGTHIAVELPLPKPLKAKTDECDIA